MAGQQKIQPFDVCVNRLFNAEECAEKLLAAYMQFYHAPSTAGHVAMHVASALEGVSFSFSKGIFTTDGCTALVAALRARAMLLTEHK